MRLIFGLLVLWTLILNVGGSAFAAGAGLGQQKPADVQCGCIHGDRLSKPDVEATTGAPVPGGVTATTGTPGV